MSGCASFLQFCQVGWYATSRPGPQAGVELYWLAYDLPSIGAPRLAESLVERYLQWRGFRGGLP